VMQRRSAAGDQFMIVTMRQCSARDEELQRWRAFIFLNAVICARKTTSCTGVKPHPAGGPAEWGCCSMSPANEGRCRAGVAGAGCATAAMTRAVVPCVSGGRGRLPLAAECCDIADVQRVCCGRLASAKRRRPSYRTDGQSTGSLVQYTLRPATWSSPHAHSSHLNLQGSRHALSPTRQDAATKH